MKKEQLTISTPDTLFGARSLLRNGLMQNNLDANFFQIENLDISNLHFPGPPTQTAPPHRWFNSYNATTFLFGSTQPNFTDIAGALTHLQQIGINEVGRIGSGVWDATIILGAKLDTLDRIRAPQGNVNLNLNRIVNLQDPLDSQDAVTLNTAHQLSGRNPKQAVKAVATTLKPLLGLAAIDGVTLADGDRVLLTAQTLREYENGIWIAHTGGWTRPSDFDNSPPTVPDGQEIDDAGVFVLQGTLHAGETWFQDTDPPVHLSSNTDGRYPHFVMINRSLDISAGPGLQKVGTVISAVGTSGRIVIGTGIDIDPVYIGQSSIRTLGIITSGTWRGSVLEGQYGGTGIANTGKHIYLTLGDFFISTASDPTYPGEPDAPPGSNLTLRIRGVSNVVVPQLGILSTTDQAETLKNKRIVKRVVSVSNASTPNINVDTTDVFRLYAQNSNITSMTTGLSGLPTDGQELQIWIQEPPPATTPSAFSITWGSAWTGSPGLPLPIHTTGHDGTLCFFIFNQQINLWVLTQLLEEINGPGSVP